MNCVHKIAVVICILAVNVAVGQSKDILFFGNSFTYGSQSMFGVPDLLTAFADESGLPIPNVVDTSQSGFYLEDHLIESLDEIPTLSGNNQWEAVVIQGNSSRPAASFPGSDPAQFVSDAVDLYQAVAAHSPAVDAVMYETWARALGHSVYSGGNPTYPGGPSQMQSELRFSYNQADAAIDNAAGSDASTVAYAGTAWEDGNFLNMHTGDNRHANDRGIFLSALVVFGTVYDQPICGVDLTGVGAAANLSSSEVAELIGYANTVLPALSAGPADLDMDGDVDNDDLTLINNAFGLSSEGDVDGDGDTDGFDFLMWQRDFGSVASCNTTAIPEPSSIAILVGAGILLPLIRRRNLSSFP